MSRCSCPGRREAAPQRKPPLAGVIDELQLPAVELLEPPPPLDGLEGFAGVGRIIPPEPNAVRLPRHARGPQPARRRPVVDRVVVGRLVNRHVMRRIPVTARCSSRVDSRLEASIPPARRAGQLHADPCNLCMAFDRYIDPRPRWPRLRRSREGSRATGY